MADISSPDETFSFLYGVLLGAVLGIAGNFAITVYFRYLDATNPVCSKQKDHRKKVDHWMKVRAFWLILLAFLLCGILFAQDGSLSYFIFRLFILESCVFLWLYINPVND